MGGYEISWIAAQIGAVVFSGLLLYGIQRLLSTPIEGDEQILDALQRADQLEERARQRSLQILNTSCDLE